MGTSKSLYAIAALAAFAATGGAQARGSHAPGVHGFHFNGVAVPQRVAMANHPMFRHHEFRHEFERHGFERREFRHARFGFGQTGVFLWPYASEPFAQSAVNVSPGGGTAVEAGVTGIREAPVARPVIYVIDQGDETTSRGKRRSSARVLERDGHGQWADLENEAVENPNGPLIIRVPVR